MTTSATGIRHDSGIGDYAIIGDCRSAALVSRDGSLDWLCWPRFDSPSVFAGILDGERGGRWTIDVPAATRRSRRYLPETNVLETRFASSTGVTTLTDFMPLADEAFGRRHLTSDHAIVRMLRCESGQGEIRIHFEPRPDFGRRRVSIVDRGKLGLRVESDHGMLALHTQSHLKVDGGTASGSIAMRAGDVVPLILTYAESSPEVMPDLGDADESLKRTVAWWRAWAADTAYRGPFRDAVVRSALAVKLLTYPSSGAIIAAPTTSLPERVGGELNWDYRYCWLRDAAFTMEALCGTGHVAEAEAFAEWLLHATRRTQPKLMVVYDVHGNRPPRERSLEHLAGHRGSSPVRVGNAARDQTQLDTYGEVVMGVARLIEQKKEPADRETSAVLAGFGRYVCKHWREPDAGIWEERGQAQVHTHSRLLSWATLDTLVRLSERGLLHKKGRSPAFAETRDVIRRAIEDESWDAQRDSYLSEPAEGKLDSVLLLMSIVGFRDATDARVRSTALNVERALGAGPSLLYRNLPADGRPSEGAFGICGFWRVWWLADGGGTLVEAERAFAEILATANDVGLLAEEVDPADNSPLGNFPQAFSHVGLINAALAIERRREREKGERR